jgi:GH24 family phage-related lysozyme (muramidase)
MGLVARLRNKVRIRRGLYADADASVRWWAKRAGGAHGRRRLREAVAKRALRKTQLESAERSLDRHDGIDSVSDAGVAMVAGFEGFRSKPYRDAVGVWTIGYGETRGIGPNTKPWSRTYAAKQLRARVNRDYLAPVLRTAKATGLSLKQTEADALASLVYNLGPGILESGRTMGDALRSKNRSRIANAFLVYDKAGGRTLLGLTRRRKAERSLFLK